MKIKHFVNLPLRSLHEKFDYMNMTKYILLQKNDNIFNDFGFR